MFGFTAIELAVYVVFVVLAVFVFGYFALGNNDKQGRERNLVFGTTSLVDQLMSELEADLGPEFVSFLSIYSDEKLKTILERIGPSSYSFENRQVPLMAIYTLFGKTIDGILRARGDDRQRQGHYRDGRVPEYLKRDTGSDDNPYRAPEPES